MNLGTVGTRRTRVAIVVTCFNSGTTLPDTIASIRENAGLVELVVVDDGSSDQATLDVLSDLERSGVEVIRQQNQGQSMAASRGASATRAPYVMRFDSDDLLEPGAVDALADALDRAPEAAAAWGDFQTFGLTSFLVPGANALDPWLVTHVNLIPGSGALIRRTALDAAGGWRLCDGFEDWDLWMSFAELGFDGVYVPGTVFRYRRSDASRQAKGRPLTAHHYADLVSQHRALVRTRLGNMKRSRAPVALKLLVPAIETLPLPRLAKINACEFLARLLWSSRPHDALAMLRQGFGIRTRGWRPWA